MKKSRTIKSKNLTIKDNIQPLKDVLNNNKEVKKVGRPSINLAEYENELYELLSVGGTISQVLEYLGIDSNTYYRYLEKNKGFRDKMARARNSIVLKAKKNIAQKINVDDIDTSKWYLERTEFRNKETTAFESDSEGVKFVITRG